MLLKKFPYLWAIFMFVALELTWFFFYRDDYIERLQASFTGYFLGLVLKLLIFISFARLYIWLRKINKIG